MIPYAALGVATGVRVRHPGYVSRSKIGACYDVVSMRPAPLSPWSSRLPAIALLAAFAGQSFFASRGKSPVFDEPAHIAAGLSYLETGNFTLDIASIRRCSRGTQRGVHVGGRGSHWPDTAETRAVASGGAGPEWPIGNSIIAGNGPDRVLFWARLPFVFLATLLGALIYFWGRELAGEAAGLGALFLYAFDPTILAHSLSGHHRCRGGGDIVRNCCFYLPSGAMCGVPHGRRCSSAGWRWGWR